MKAKFTLLACTALATLGLATQANALTYTQSIQFGPGPTDFDAVSGTDTAGGAPPSSFFYFDSNGGTLTSLVFSSTYGFSSSITVTNTAASASSGTVRTQSASQFSSNDASVTAALNRSVNNLVDPVDGTGVTFGNNTLSPIAYDVRGGLTSYSLAPGGTTSTSSAGNGSTGPVTNTNTADLAAFSRAGGGTYDPLFTTLSGLLLANNGGNTSAQQTTTATGTLTITYNYDLPVVPPTTVPEPASMAVLGAGLLGLGLVRRRRS